MIDFSKIFNIVFVSVCAALLLFVLISAIAVAAKGKRSCNAFDIVLRVVCAVVLVASAVMLTCSVLSMMTADSGMYIVVAQGDAAFATLVMGEKLTELPVAELFVVLSSVIGFGLSAVLFILSLVTLIVDCLVANKKDDKQQKQKKAEKPKKTPEQLKREAELERIRRIGESAVRKTSSVASAEKAEQSEKTDAAEQPETEQPVAEQPAAEEADSDFDWRAEPKAEPEHTGFVGIKDEQSEFDSFDSFDSFDGEQEARQSEGEQQVTEQSEYEPEEDAEQSEQDISGGYAEGDTDEYTEEAEQPDEEIYYDDDEQFTVDDGAVDENAEYDEQPVEQEDIVDENSEYSEQAEYDEYTEETEAAEQDEEPIAYEEPSEAVEEYADETVDEAVDEPAEAPQEQLDDIEPDRGIYIPEIRTVTRNESVQEKKPATPAPKKATAPKKAAPKKTAATKKTPPKKATDGGASQRPIPPEKKLPVTRRYVILDRHNAVNMFGEYLKERNQVDKDRLKSSINTIIIE